MRIALLVGLLEIGILLFLAKKWIGDNTLQRLANAFAVVALIAAGLVFVVPAPTPTEPIGPATPTTDLEATRPIMQLTATPSRVQPTVTPSPTHVPTSTPSRTPTGTRNSDVTSISPTPTSFSGNPCPYYGADHAVSNMMLFKPTMVITGPAALHPLKGSFELGKLIGFDDIPRWGINILAGKSVQIPPLVTLSNGSQYEPEGYYELYANNADAQASADCWLKNNR